MGAGLGGGALGSGGNGRDDAIGANCLGAFESIVGKIDERLGIVVLEATEGGTTNADRDFHLGGAYGYACRFYGVTHPFGGLGGTVEARFPQEQHEAIGFVAS
jgi:hypothetical protein